MSDKMRLVTATFNIQRSMEVLLMYSPDEQAEEYLKKVEDFANYCLREEERLVQESRKGAGII